MRIIVIGDYDSKKYQNLIEQIDTTKHTILSLDFNSEIWTEAVEKKEAEIKKSDMVLVQQDWKESITARFDLDLAMRHGHIIWDGDNNDLEIKNYLTISEHL